MMKQIQKSAWIIGGTVCIGLGLLGVFLPILPTTPFLLLAAFCYGRGSKRFYHWLVHQSWAGNYIQNYLSGNGIPAKQKAFTIALLWLTIGATIGLPLGNQPYESVDYSINMSTPISNVATMVYAVDLQGEYAISSPFALVFSIGYVNYVIKSDYPYLKMRFIPVLAGVKYYFLSKFYGCAQAGYSFASDGGGRFTIAPSIGYKVSEKFDISLRYQSALKDVTYSTNRFMASDYNESASFLGVRAGLRF